MTIFLGGEPALKKTNVSPIGTVNARQLLVTLSLFGRWTRLLPNHSKDSLDGPTG